MTISLVRGRIWKHGASSRKQRPSELLPVALSSDTSLFSLAASILTTPIANVRRICSESHHIGKLEGVLSLSELDRVTTVHPHSL